MLKYLYEILLLRYSGKHNSIEKVKVNGSYLKWMKDKI